MKPTCRMWLPAMGIWFKPASTLPSRVSSRPLKQLPYVFHTSSEYRVVASTRIALNRFAAPRFQPESQWTCRLSKKIAQRQRVTKCERVGDGVPSTMRMAWSGNPCKPGGLSQNPAGRNDLVVLIPYDVRAGNGWHAPASMCSICRRAAVCSPRMCRQRRDEPFADQTATRSVATGNRSANPNAARKSPRLAGKQAPIARS